MNKSLNDPLTEDERERYKELNRIIEDNQRIILKTGQELQKAYDDWAAESGRTNPTLKSICLDQGMSSQEFDHMMKLVERGTAGPRDLWKGMFPDEAKSD